MSQPLTRVTPVPQDELFESLARALLGADQAEPAASLLELDVAIGHPRETIQAVLDEWARAGLIESSFAEDLGGIAAVGAERLRLTSAGQSELAELAPPRSRSHVERVVARRLLEASEEPPGDPSRADSAYRVAIDGAMAVVGHEWLPAVRAWLHDDGLVDAVAVKAAGGVYVRFDIKRLTPSGTRLLSSLVERPPPPALARPFRPLVAADAPGLRGVAAMNEIMSRMEEAIEESEPDPPAAIGAAKELVEAAAKAVLASSNETIGSDEDVASLIKRAHDAVGAHARQVEGDGRRADALRKIRGGLQAIVLGVVDLRNDVGTGHGRLDPTPDDLFDDARLAAQASTAWTRSIVGAFVRQRAVVD